MKLNVFFIISLLASVLYGQIPSGYYDSAEGKIGYELKTALKNIIDGHTVLSYGSLNNYYSQLDKDLYYENDGTLLDIYSEKPNGPDPYNYGFGNGDQCGNYNSENDCWNKEHVFPQGFFNEKLPMRSDLHQVLPVDGYVNNRRSNFNFGKVNNPTWTSMNGSKVGPCSSPGSSGTCFEPIDEFKGDIARIMLYFATRYENEVTSNGWKPHTTPNSPLNGTNNQVYKDWIIDLFLSWHEQDPVSQKEIDRNNGVYQLQGNRNPYVDHPEWVRKVWDPENANVNDLEKQTIKIFPNPVKDVLKIEAQSSIERIEVYNLNGEMMQNLKPNSFSATINFGHFPAGVYLLKTITKEKVSTQKIIKK